MILLIIRPFRNNTTLWSSISITECSQNSTAKTKGQPRNRIRLPRASLGRVYPYIAVVVLRFGFLPEVPVPDPNLLRTMERRPV